jgi:hypothetical protein
VIDVILTCLAAATSTNTLEQELALIVAGRGGLPSLAQVQEAAVAALALTDAEEVEAWSSRARLRGLAPTVDARFGTTTDLDVRGEVDGEGWTRVGRGLGLDVSTRFNLGDLVFSDQELRASRERLARSAAIRLARERATRIYFQRVANLLEVRARPNAAALLEAARLDGLLQAVTGGRLVGPREKK